VSSDHLAALGSFLSGMASVITATVYVRRVKRNAKRECDERLAEFERALHEGVDIGRGQ
jgi:hypothetical protein